MTEKPAEIFPGSGITRWCPVRRREGRLPHVVGTPIELTRLSQSLDPPSGMSASAEQATMNKNTACVGATSEIAPPTSGPTTMAMLPARVTSALMRLSSSRSSVRIGGVRARDGLGHAPCEPEHSGPDVDAHDARTHHW